MKRVLRKDEVKVPRETAVRVDWAFSLIAKCNTVSIMSLDEMEAVVLRALSKEFDPDIAEAQEINRVALRVITDAYG